LVASFPALSDPFNLTAIAVLVILGLAVLILRGKDSWLTHIQSKPLLTVTRFARAWSVPVYCSVSWPSCLRGR
jgi:hypothetical protein